MIGEVEAIFAAPWSPPSADPVDLWVEQYVELGPDSDLQGRVSFDLLPMARFFLRACQNPGVRRVVAMVSAQSGKTKTCEFYLVWKVRNDPAPTCWFTDDDKQAKVFSQTRLDPDLRSCRALAEEWPQDRNRRKWWLYQLASMDLYIRGVNAKKQAEQISVETVICDERRNYPLGRMQSIRNRYKTFRRFKEISISTAGIENDDLHRAFNEGTRHFFHWSCLQCGHRQPFRFGRKANPLYPEDRERGGIVWETNEKTKIDDNTYNLDELRKTVRYECEGCGRRYENWEKPLLIATMDERNNWGAVQTNPMAQPDTVSMHWNELYMPWDECDWGRIVDKFIRAQAAIALKGDIEPLKVFLQESLGEPWREPEGQKAEPTLLMGRCGDHCVGDEPRVSGKLARIITVDVQAGFLVYVLRAYDPNGTSWLIDCGKVLGFDELRAYQVSKKVKDGCVGIDCAHKPAVVLQECLRHGLWRRGGDGTEFWDGWMPMIGDDAKEFSKRDRDGFSVKAYWKASEVDANIGFAGKPRPIQRVSWSNEHYRDVLYQYLIPGTIGSWFLPRDIDQHLDGDYLKQMSATERRDVRDAEGNIVGHEWHEKGRHDFSDCELMQLVMADLFGIARGPTTAGSG